MRQAAGVGRILPFRRGRRLRSIDEFDSRQRVRFWRDDDRVTVRGVVRDTFGWLRALRPFILFALLVTTWIGYDPALVDPPEWLATPPEHVAEDFTRCGPGRAHACVIDGDTFKLGERRIRIIGIDTPETHPPRCAEEARLGDMATDALLGLLNQGPFEMVAWAHNSHDRYGRDLRVIRRKLPDGSYQSIAEEMRKSGLAHRYLGGFKIGWC